MKRLKNTDVWDLAGHGLPAAALICGGVMGVLIVCVNFLNLVNHTTPLGFVLYPAAGTGMVLAVAALCRTVPAKNGARFCVCLSGGGGLCGAVADGRACTHPAGQRFQCAL